jgi:hypothetical protein
LSKAENLALRDWKQKRLLQLQNIDELRYLWLEGIDSGTGQYDIAVLTCVKYTQPLGRTPFAPTNVLYSIENRYSIDDLKQEARRRLGQTIYNEV